MKKLLICFVFLLATAFGGTNLVSPNLRAMEETGDARGIPVVLYGKQADETPTPMQVDSDGKLVISGGSSFNYITEDAGPPAMVKISENLSVDKYIYTSKELRKQVVILTSDTDIDDTINGYVGLDSSGGDFTITMADISLYSGEGVGDITFFKISDGGTVNFELADATQTLGDFSTLRLRQKGFGINVVRNTNMDKYWFTPVGASTSLILPIVATDKPVLVTTTLTMNGTLSDMSGNSTVDVYFHYRESGTTTWTATTAVAKTSTGTFNTTATVTAGLTYEVRAVVEVADGSQGFGAVLTTDNNYYSTMQDAIDAGLKRYWEFQETSGTDTDCDDLVEADMMRFYNGVTIGSDTINGNIIYKRIFGPSDYGEASFQMQREGRYTFLIQIDMNSASGDHTIFNNGTNFLSMASDGTRIQLEVGSNIQTWSSATPFSAIKNLFITYDFNNWVCYVYEVTSTTVTQRIVSYNMPSYGTTSQFFRLGRGASGDANHQDNEYMDDGEVRSVAIWEDVLSSSVMRGIVDVLDNDGGLIVADSSYTPVPAEHGVNASIVNHRDVCDSTTTNVTESGILVWDDANNEFVDEASHNGAKIIGDLTVNGTVVGGESSFINGCDLEYNSTTSLTVSGGFLVVDGSYTEVSETLHTVSNFSSGGYTYIYVNSSGTITDSTTEPTEQSDCTWYNGTTRCIGALYCDSATTIEQFARTGKRFLWFSKIQIQDNLNPSSVYVYPSTKTSTILPVNARSAILQIQGSDTGVTASAASSGTLGQSYAQAIQLFAIGNTTAGSGGEVFLASDREVVIGGQDDDDNLLDAWLTGYTIYK